MSTVASIKQRQKSKGEKAQAMKALDNDQTRQKIMDRKQRKEEIGVALPKVLYTPRKMENLEAIMTVI